MATRITPTGETVEFKLESADLKYLQGLVGGFIEFLGFRDGSALMLHEEGKLIGLPMNDHATALAIIKGSPDAIAGTAIYLIPAEMKWLDLDEKERPDSPPLTNIDLGPLIRGGSKIEA